MQLHQAAFIISTTHQMPRVLEVAIREAAAMIALLCFFLILLVSPFKSKIRLGAENAALRREVIILRRKVRGRVHLTNGDRFFFVQLYRWFPSVLNIITIT